MRFFDCRFFGSNKSWITDDDSTHYKCPICLRNYTQHKDSPQQMHANKVVVLDVSGNAKLARHFQCGKRDLLFFYVTLADTAAERADLQMRLTPIELNVDEQLRHLPEDALYDMVISVIQESCQRSYFTRTELHPYAADEMKRLNSSAKRQRQWQHLEKGFNSATAPWVEEHTKVLSIDELLFIQAHCNYLMNHVTR